MIYLGIFITFALAPITFWLVAIKASEKFKQHATRHWWAVYGLGIYSCAWLLEIFMRLAPGHSATVYLVAVLLLIGVGLMYSRIAIPECMRLFIAPIKLVGKGLKDLDFPLFISIASVLVIAVLTLFTALSNPLTANDPLKYATTARLIWEHGTPAVYPFITADPTTGYIAPSSHPPGFPMMLVWGYLWSGSTTAFGLNQFYSPILMLACAFALLQAGRQIAWGIGELAAVLYVATPLFIIQTSVMHIDAVRIYPIFAAGYWLYQYLKLRTTTHLVLGAVFGGIAMYVHSLGAVGFTALALALFLLLRQPWPQRLKTLTLVGLIAFCVTGVAYVQNIVRYGTPIKSGTAVTSQQDLDYSTYLQYSRGLGDFKDQILNGVLRGFTETDRYGYAHWLFLAGLITLIIVRTRNRELWMFVAPVIFWYALVMFTVLSGNINAIKNGRYLLTIHPFICFTAGFLAFGLNRIQHAKTD